VEFGVFGSAGLFDKGLTLNSGVGGGGRVGIFLDPRWALEFEGGEMSATRTLGLKRANVGIMSARLVATPIRGRGISIVLGAGAGAGTETNFLHSYGVNALVGAKFALGDIAAVRIDAISDWLANYSWKSYQSVHVGLSLFRNPHRVARIVEVPVAMVPRVQTDSVGADEQARLRRADADYRSLRDSLSRRTAVDATSTPPIIAAASAIATPAAVVPTAPTSSTEPATTEETIHFANERSELNAESRAILDVKLKAFRANPSTRIIIVSDANERASDAFDLRLGGRRSAAAKAYLVERGTDPGRITIVTEGTRSLAAGWSPRTGESRSRRDEFRLLIASDVATPTKP
jgi:peptidoglycan-associated lipoprotein